MDTQKTIALILGLVIISNVQSQSIIEDRTGFVNSQGNIAAGYLFVQKQPAAYIIGESEIFVKNQIALTGSAWFFVPVSRKPTGLKANHTFTWGFNYHFLKKGRFDPYVGLTPGISIVRVAYNTADGELKKAPFGVAPLFSAAVGFNYYVGSIFHFFLKAQGVSGEFSGGAPNRTPLHEIKLTAGLGWNARFWKPGALKRELERHGLSTTDYLIE